MTGLVGAAAAPLSIAFAGHIDRRRVLLALLVALAVSNVLAAIAGSLTMILVGRFLLGLAVGAFWTIAGSLGPRPEGVKANAVILSGISFGTVAGVPAGAVIGDVFDWRVSFWAGALLAVISILAVMALLPFLPAKNQRVPLPLFAAAAGRGDRAVTEQQGKRILLVGEDIDVLAVIGLFPIGPTDSSHWAKQVHHIHVMQL
ncbi:MFS transporter [Rhizobium leguminosarum]